MKLENPIDSIEINHFFDQKKSFKIEEFDFPHLLYSLSRDTFHASNISAHIRKLFKKLDITNQNGKGAILILHTTYIFACPLTSPYNYYNNIPMFADPEFFAGIFCLPAIETVWPQTIKDKYIENNFLDILKISTTKVNSFSINLSNIGNPESDEKTSSSTYRIDVKEEELKKEKEELKKEERREERKGTFKKMTIKNDGKVLNSQHK